MDEFGNKVGNATWWPNFELMLVSVLQHATNRMHLQTRGLEILYDLWSNLALYWGNLCLRPNEVDVKADYEISDFGEYNFGGLRPGLLSVPGDLLQDYYDVVHYCTLCLSDNWVSRQSAEWEPPICGGTL